MGNLLMDILLEYKYNKIKYFFIFKNNLDIQKLKALKKIF